MNSIKYVLLSMLFLPIFIHAMDVQRQRAAQRLVSDALRSTRTIASQNATVRAELQGVAQGMTHVEQRLTADVRVVPTSFLSRHPGVAVATGTALGAVAMFGISKWYAWRGTKPEDQRVQVDVPAPGNVEVRYVFFP